MTNDKPDPSPPPAARRKASRSKASRRIPLAIAALVIAAVIGSIAANGLKRSADDGDPSCRAAVDLAHKLSPLVHGEVAALTLATAPLRLPDLAFADQAGQPKKLSDWHGRTILLNLWATWCVPCRKEMPALDGLQARLGGPDFQVVAVNIDTRDLDKPKTFLNDSHLEGLDYFSDSKAKVFQDLKQIGRALGMPTSVLVDGQGCEIGTIAGAADWASEDAIRLISAAKAAPGS